ncbi:MAG: phosphoribosylglycinamide formyltransferase [Pseudomonadota bacterium]
MTRRIAILISGRGSNMATLIDAAKAADFPGSVELVISSHEEAGGLVLAREAGVPAVAVPRKAYKGKAAFEAALSEELAKADIDFICLAGFMRVLSPEFVTPWNDRMLNIHPSLLPLFPGLDVHEQALEAGVAVSGCTVHLVTADLDAGPIIGQAAVPVMPSDTPQSLAARVQKAEHRLYPAALAHYLSGKLGGGPSVTQSEGCFLSLR